MNDRQAEMTIALDIECMTALEQMATAENMTISDVLKSSIAARWKTFCETERRRREAALRRDQIQAMYAMPGRKVTLAHDRRSRQPGSGTPI